MTTLLLIVLLSYAAAAQDTMLGCYSDGSSTPLLNGLAGNPTIPNPYVYEYQSSGKCTEVCSSRGFIYAGTQNGNECYCGNYTPPLSLRVDSSKCNIPCAGYPFETCGGAKYLNVYIVSDRKPSTTTTT
ncbi:WSC-domain-containing protein, partial [Basidiobolus meristosporus CBS 931.73]